MSAGFAYLNARVRSRRSQTVADSFFKAALNQSFPEFVRSFSETVYGPDLTGETLADIDAAIAKHQERTVNDLPSLASGALRDVVALPLLRADLNNLKTIIRGKQAQQNADDIAARLAGGTFKAPLLKALLDAPDVASMAQVLRLPGHPLAKALQNAATAASPLAIELTLERDFFARAAQNAKKSGQAVLAKYFQLELDATNLSTAFKLRGLGATNTESYFISGGRLINAAQFVRIAEGDRAALDALSNSPLADAAGAASLSELEPLVRKALLAQSSKGSLDVLGAGLVLSYVRAKAWEAARLRLLARRAYFNLPVEAVAKEVDL